MTASRWSRRALVGGGAAIWAGRALAQPSTGTQATAALVPPAGADGAETLKTGLDLARRMTAQVFLDGRGPFAFLVDTGADRSIVSFELASALGLAAGPKVMVHGVAGDVTVASAAVGELTVGSRRTHDAHLPLLAAGNIGAAGVLGIDVLQGERVVLDFRAGRIVVADSPPLRLSADAVVVKARSRFGQLVLIDSSLDGEPVLVVIDTGAEGTIANTAFRRRIRAERADKAGDPTQIVSVTGQTTTGAWAVVPAVQLGGFQLNHLPVVFSDLRSFARWRLQDQPALLLGMDVLRKFDAVEIDFARREVRFSGLHALERRLADKAIRLA